MPTRLNALCFYFLPPLTLAAILLWWWSQHPMLTYMQVFLRVWPMVATMLVVVVIAAWVGAGED